VQIEFLGIFRAQLERDGAHHLGFGFVAVGFLGHGQDQHVLQHGLADLARSSILPACSCWALTTTST
jgi:hypothetical protein